MKIVLFQPQIPQNTGNIVRTCSLVGAQLVLVRPLGFSLASRHLKRAGLDYWHGVDITIIDDLPKYLSQQQAPYFLFSSKAEKLYTEATYSKDCILIFGSETSGLPDTYHEMFFSKRVTLPQKKGFRCLNLANSVAIGLYEAWRQCGFCDLNSHDANAKPVGLGNHVVV